MKRILLIVGTCIGLFTNAFAQNAKETTVKFKKENQPAAMAQYNLPEEIVMDALVQYLEKAGLGKKTSEKGFRAFKGATWQELSSDKMDIYFKVEGKSQVATVYMLVSKGYDNFVSKANDEVLMNKLIAFLNAFDNDANKYMLQQNIAAQGEVVKKAQANLADIQKEGKELAEDREKVEKKIAQNKTEQINREEVLEAEIKRLESLKAQLAN